MIHKGGSCSLTQGIHIFSLTHSTVCNERRAVSQAVNYTSLRKILKSLRSRTPNSIADGSMKPMAMKPCNPFLINPSSVQDPLWANKLPLNHTYEVW